LFKSISVIIALLNAVFPWNKLYKKYFPDEETPLTETYEYYQDKKKFATDFYIENPAY